MTGLFIKNLQNYVAGAKEKLVLVVTKTTPFKLLIIY